MGARSDDVVGKLHDAELAVLPVSAAQVSRARAVVAARARDEADRRLLLSALGLDGVRPRLNNTGRKALGSQTVHGTGGGVAAHKWDGDELCDACERWMEVHLHKGGAASPDCGTYGAYGAHVKACQKPDEACMAARRLYQNDQKTKRRQATPAPLVDGGGA